MQLNSLKLYLLLVGICVAVSCKSADAQIPDRPPISNLVKTDTLPRLIPPNRALPYIEDLPHLFYIKLPQEEVKVKWDTTEKYIIQHDLFGQPVSPPSKISFSDYVRSRRNTAKQSNWKLLIEESSADEQERGLLDFKVDIQAGEESAFSTIFGKPEVNLRINGRANMNLGASIQKMENPEIPPDQQTRVDPTFSQDLRLNIQGTIGDKLSIQTDWDTERDFDFMNRLNIEYEGYEDEILQQVKLGNVSMQTGNSLIRGGSALFGVKSEAQIGGLKLTSVLSQQEGEGQTETITGGAQEKEISIRPADYEEDRHFFLDFYPWQEFESNLSNPQQIEQALQLSEVRVWILREATKSVEGERAAVALADLGVIETQNGEYAPPDETEDIFDQSTLEQFRDPSQGVSASDFGVDPSSFVEGYFIPLQEGVDYELDRALGYISLNRDLGARQALAVSFKYRDALTGQIVSVGEQSQGGGERIYLKLIRPQTVTTTNSLWDLMMKNVYSVGASNLTPDGLDLDINYTEQNVAQSSLPGRDAILLQDLGLDRVDAQGALIPDNKIDFSTGVLNSATGRIIFPYLEPFGSRVADLLLETGLSEEEIGNIAFEELYEEKKANADQNSKNNFYLIDGEARGSISDSYSLGFSLVEGSVKVFANGRELQEGTDYAVDYAIGSISILNSQYLKRGQEITIEYENNQMTQIGRKTFTGLRAEYQMANNITLGSTYFRLKERSLQDKIRLGDEPVNNAVIGFDANAYYETPWLTRMINRVPLLQTKEPSSFSFSGEFARLEPGVSQTGAVNDAIRDNRLFEDEKNGLSFIDDFEGSEINLSFLNPSRWNLAASPAAVPGYEPDQLYFEENPPENPPNSISDKIARSDLRGEFNWYSIPQNIDEILGGVTFTPESEPVQVTDVFPNRDVLTEENFISTLDVYFDPTQRGQYNYNNDLRNLLENEPERTWGGMTAVLPSGQEDFTQNNIEFLEFWMQSLLPNGRGPSAQDLLDYEGTIYIDVGVVSEDVVPNSRTNSEDGLVRRPDDLQEDNISGNSRSYIPTPPPAPEGEFSNETRELEDVGLDGAPNTGGIADKNEQNLFSDFIENAATQYGMESRAFSEIQNDPSNDDYVYYGEDQLSERPLHERFHRMYGYHDGNSPPSTGDKRAVTNDPDTEGLLTPSIVEQNNSYFQYEIDWNPADIDNLEPGAEGTYIVDKVDGMRQSDRWYQVRIPLDDWVRRVGGIENFQNISYIRVWLSGYEQPFTIRFASFDLVGSQWRNADNVDEEQGVTQGEYNISSVNIEENSQRFPIPYRQPEGALRATNRSRQRQTVENEQSIVMDVQNLGPGELKMMKRVYPGGMNMINYSNLRMFVHGEGYDNREDVELVLRLGTDLTNNYYEYRQPISPSDPNYNYNREDLTDLSEAELEMEAEQVWLYNENSMNIVLRAFNELKQLRDQQGRNITDRFERGDLLRRAPAGAVIAIKGNPSLDRVGEIGLGIQNPFDPQNPENGVGSLDGQFWFNELRVSGFDNKSGWAANTKADLKLADFATVNANLNRETDGFGALNSGLGQRRQSDLLAYDLNSTVNVHKILPERYGWNFPVSLSTRRSSSTPRYLPNQGDVRLTEFENVINARNDLSQEQKKLLINRQILESQTVSESYSLNISNLTKNGSQSNLLRYTLDQSTMNYVYNKTDRRNPRYEFQDNWNYEGSIRYNISFPGTPLFRPFNFLSDVPFLHPLAGIRLGYAPSSLSTNFGIDREYNEQLRRALSVDTDPSLQQSHSFTYDTQFGFGYNMTPSIRTTFNSRTVFDLSRAGVEYEEGENMFTDSATYTPRPTFDVLGDIVFDTLSSRRSNYEEAYTAGWQPRLDKVDAFEWINYSANYGGGYQWRNSPLGSGLGANISNNFTLNQTLDFDLGSLFNRWEWFQKLQNGFSDERDQEADTTRRYSQEDLGKVLKYAGKRGLQTLFSIRSLDVSFNISKNSLQTGYAGDSQIYYMFGGGETFTPPLSYRTGFEDHIRRSRLISLPEDENSVQLPSNRTLSDDLTFRSRFMPGNNLTVDLTWNNEWNKTLSRSTTLTMNDISTVRSQSGVVHSSVWAFGEGYGNFFRRQLETAFDDISTNSTAISDSAGNNDGRAVLEKNTMQDDFRRAYLGIGKGAIGKKNFMPFPFPNWQVRWTGLESWFPFLGDYMVRASLNHNYNGLYRLGWLYNSQPDQLPTISLGNYSVTNFQREYEPSMINIEKNFSPLLGLNITWQSNLRTNLQYEYNKVASLSLSNFNVIERLSRGLKLTLSYTVRDFKIPFFPRLENALDFTLNGSYIEDEEEKFVLNSDLENALEAPPDQIVENPEQYDFASSFTGGQSRINGSAVIGYQFSQTLQANFEYNYNRLIPKSSRVFARTDHDIRFNIVVNIRSN